MTNQNDKQEGVLLWVLNLHSHHSNFTEGDKYVGFDVDLSEAIAKKTWFKNGIQIHGLRCLIPAVQSDDIDIVVAGISWHLNVKKHWTSPMYTSTRWFHTVVRKDNTTIITWMN